MIINTSTKHASNKKPIAKDDVLLNNGDSWVNIIKQPHNLGISHYGNGWAMSIIFYINKADSFLEDNSWHKPYLTGSVVTLTQE